MMFVLLASASPRRAALLRQMGVDFEVRPAEIDEGVGETLPPRDHAVELACRKARQVAAGAAPSAADLVLGADTVVAAGEQIIGKPGDRNEAEQILRQLMGTTHRVITGVCLIDPRRGREETFAEETRVRMRPMTEAELRAYLDSGGWRGKAGAYGIQESADPFVEVLEGSFDNVVGLPPERLAEVLRTMMA